MTRLAYAFPAAALITAAALLLLVTTALAAGPRPGTGPWIDGTGLVTCLAPGTHPMWNTASEKGHCFKD